MAELQRWEWFGALADGRDLAALSQAPAEYRVAPGWLLEDPLQHTRARCEAIGAIDLTGDEWDDERVTAWADKCPFDNVTHLSLSAPRMGSMGLSALLQRWPRLRSVSLRNIEWERLEPAQLAVAGPCEWALNLPPKSALARWIEALSGGPVAALRLSGASLGAADIPAKSWQQLQQLTFGHCEFEGNALAAWLEAAGPNLDHLSITGKLSEQSLRSLSSSVINPRVLRLWLPLSGDGMAQMLQAGALDRLVSLALMGGDFGDGQLSQLASKLSTVRELDLSGSRLTVAQCEQLLTAAPQLERLSLADTGIAGDTLALAWEAAGLSKLIELDVSGLVGASHALASAAGSALPRLRALGLRDSATDGPGLASLLGCDLPQLQLLDVSDSRLDSLNLDRPVCLPALRYLEAEFSQLEISQPAHLFSPSALPSLRTLRVEKNRLSREAGEALARLFAEIPIRSLDLNDSVWLDGETYAQAVSAAAWSLVHFVAGHRGCPQPGLAEVLANASWPLLSVLDVVEARFSLSQWSDLQEMDCPRLIELSISFCELEELKVLANSTLMRHLRRFRCVPEDDIDHDAIQALVESGTAKSRDIEFSFF